MFVFSTVGDINGDELVPRAGQATYRAICKAYDEEIL
jgi:hypothetical protein